MEDMLWGAKRDGGTVGKVEWECGPIYGVAAVRAVSAGARAGGILFCRSVVCDVVQVAEVLAEGLFCQVGPERDFGWICEVG